MCVGTTPTRTPQTITNVPNRAPNTEGRNTNMNIRNGDIGETERVVDVPKPERAPIFPTPTPTPTPERAPQEIPDWLKVPTIAPERVLVPVRR